MNFLPYIAAVAIAGVSEAIKVYTAGKNQDKVNEFNADLESLKQEQANVINTEKLRVQRFRTRKRIADLNTEFANRGLKVEGDLRKGSQQAIETAQIGSEEYLTRTAGLGAQIIAADSDLRAAASESSLGMGGAITGSVLGAASSVLASGELNDEIAGLFKSDESTA
tara:strand:+ start:28 stop:528 length:501 start_codon:yes stop_codon:yes gene_type:complete